jgi:ribosome-associated protein
MNNIPKDSGFDGPSKSQLKRESLALQELGKELVEMPEGKLQEFNLPETLKNAIYEARKLTNGEAKRRHLQYIGKLMRVNDISEIQKTISKINQKSLAYRQRLKQINQWQEQIISQGAMAINDFVDRYPDADRQKLSNLKRQINREVALKKTPSAKKKLFDYIKSLDD